MDPSKADSYPINMEPIEEESLKSLIQENMETFCSSICIYKVPEEISIDNKSVFVPVKVSIGPFHHGNPLLKPMEDHKWRYLSSLLERGSSYQNQLDVITRGIAENESRVRKCYAVEFEMESKIFNQILLLDCCFILELLLRFSIKSPKRRTDPIFTTPGLLFDLRCDMILLENQVPLFLLKCIFERLDIPQFDKTSLNNLMFRFFRTMIFGQQQFILEKYMNEGDHLLDMVHYCFLSSYPRVETKDNVKPKSLPNALMLQKGVQFKAAKNAKSLLDIKYQNSVLEIPPLKVYERSETIFMNLIAYEHCQFGTAQQVKSYVCLMGHLLQSNDDVKLLRRRKILTDNDDDEMQVIQNLKWMNQQKLNLSGAYFAGIIQQINESKCRCVGRLQTSARNPFVIGIAAILAVGVIFVAAFFSALTLLRHRYG